jgi:hypothetical protein
VLEIAGTSLGSWQWQEYDTVVGLVSQGNPPSGAAGGYRWFDLVALLVSPALLRLSLTSAIVPCARSCLRAIHSASHSSVFDP